MLSDEGEFKKSVSNIVKVTRFVVARQLETIYVRDPELFQASPWIWTEPRVASSGRIWRVWQRRKYAENGVHSVCFEVEFLQAPHSYYVVQRYMRRLFTHAFAKSVLNPKHIFLETSLTNPREPDPHLAAIERKKTTAPAKQRLLAVDWVQINDSLHL